MRKYKNVCFNKKLKIKLWIENIKRLKELYNH
jgi:hypothetical protein